MNGLKEKKRKAAAAIIRFSDFKDTFDPFFSQINVKIGVLPRKSQWENQQEKIMKQVEKWVKILEPFFYSVAKSTRNIIIIALLIFLLGAVAPEVRGKIPSIFKMVDLVVYTIESAVNWGFNEVSEIFR